MIALDEDALLCDLAETYHIHDMRSMPAAYIATLACGLREGSRIMMAINGLKVDFKTLLLAHIADSTAINVYFKTKDAEHGQNRPKSIVKYLTQKDSEIAKGFDDGDDFIEEWRRLNE